jgi:hypothetical protein
MLIFRLFCDRRSIGQSILVPGPPLEPMTRFFTIGYLRPSCCGAPSLTRGRVCNLLVQFAITLKSKSRRTHDHILLSRLRLPQPGRPGSCIYNLQEQGGPIILLGTGFPFCRLLRLAGLRWSYSNPPPNGSCGYYRTTHIPEAILLKSWYWKFLNGKVLSSFAFAVATGKKGYGWNLSPTVIPCSLLEVIRRFGEICHLHLQDFFLSLFFDPEERSR